jgi:hypothetical protein
MFSIGPAQAKIISTNKMANPETIGYGGAP